MEKFDAIIILGYGFINEKPNPILKSRLDLGIDLYKKKNSSKIVMSGGFTCFRSDISESESMRKYAIEKGVKEEDILKEESSRDTLANIYMIKKKILEPRKWRKIIIVSSDFHTKRVKFITKKILSDEYFVEFKKSSAKSFKSFVLNLFGYEKDMLELAKSVLNDIEVGNDLQIEEILKCHPFYSNEKRVIELHYSGLRELMKKFGISRKFIFKYGWYIKRKMNEIKKIEKF